MSSPNSESTNDEASKSAPFWKIGAFGGVLVVDAVTSLVALAPLWPWMRRTEGASTHYTFYASLTDLAILAALRIAASSLALLVSYWKAEIPVEYHFDLYHPNGDRKTREQLEQEALEEPFWPWFKRFLLRPSFMGEVLAVTAQVVCIVKCLARMNVEIGTLQDAEAFHPVFWLAIFCTAVLSVLEASYLDDMCKLAGRYGKEHGSQTPGILRTISSQLIAPLLDEQNRDEEQQTNGGDVAEEDDENGRATSDITSDPAYKANWSDLLMMCYPDMHMISLAFVFLLLAAVAQVYIPKFLGNILDALAAAFGDPNDDSSRHMSMWEVPHFMTNIKLLVTASVLAGVFAGLRGSIFVSLAESVCAKTIRTSYLTLCVVA
jgi:hypothetical protein